MATALAGALVVGACAGTGGGGAPAPSDASVKGLVGASVQITFRAATQVVTEVPLALYIADEARGVIETPYFDLTPIDFSAERYPERERLVRVIVVVAPDTLGRGSRVAIRTVYQGLGGQVQSRRTERLVPRDHPGTALAQDLLDRIEKRAVGAR
jgi:hypothetical protein